MENRKPSEWDVPATPPRPVGQGPFRAKGSTILTNTLALSQYVDGGLPAVLDSAGDPGLRAFWSQPILASSFYDVFGMVALVPHVARLRGVGEFAAVVDLARAVAAEDLHGLYRMLLKIASPELIAPRLPRIQGRYMDFGGVVTGESGPGRAVATRTGHPRILLHWYLAAVSGFIPYVLEAAGAKSVRIRWSRPQPDGVSFGVETVSVQVEATWGA